MDRPIVIIGAGMGGLAMALRLAHRGEKVIILEKTDQVGGRNRKVVVGGATFDGGPTLVMMLDPFRKLFADVGERLEDHLDLRLCDPGYRAFWPDGTSIDSTTDVERMVSHIRRIASNGDAGAYPGFLRRLQAMYEDAIPNFVRKNYRGVLDFASPRQLAMVMRHGLLSNLRKQVEKTFHDPRLQMLFSFQTMYLGLSPYEAPWVYGTLTYMEYGEGIWYPMGGVHRIAESMADLAEKRGAIIRLNAPVKAIYGSEVALASNERIQARTVICNADLPYAASKLLGRPPMKVRNSCSALMMYMEYEGDFPELEHHNVFFGSEFRENLEDVFLRRRIPDDPSFYVCLSHKTDRSMAKPGSANLYVLVPVPNHETPWTDESTDNIRDKVFGRLRGRTSFDPACIRGRLTFTPADWQSTLNLYQGAAFGLSHHTMQSACFRAPNKSTTNPNVYFVGASTIPGNGMPMVLISAELLEQRLIAEGVISCKG